MMQEYVNPHCDILITVSSILKVIMVSIIIRTEEDQNKIIDKGAKNKFKWSWLEKFITVEIEKKSHKIIIIIYGLNTSIWKKIFPIKSVTHH